MRVRPRYNTLAGGSLAYARALTNLTQRQVAHRSGIPQSVIAAIESGAREPSIPLLRRLVNATGHELRLSVTPLDSDADHDRVLVARAAVDPARAQAQAADIERWRGAVPAAAK